MKKFKQILVIISIVGISLILAGCTENNDKDLQSKAVSELDYISLKNIDLLNKLNNISFENYSVISQQVQLSKEEQTQTSGGGNNSGQSNQQGASENSNGGGAGGSSDTKGAEEKQEKEGESKDKVNTTTMIIQSELDKDRNKIDWTEIKKEIELLNESWSVILLDLYALEVKNDDILKFSDKINIAMIAIKEENKTQSLNALADLYSSIPIFLEQIKADKNRQKIRQTQSHVINAYILAEDIENTVISEHLEKAVTTYSEIMQDIDYIKDKTEKTNKIYVLLNELVNSIDEKDTDIFYIKYKNFMKGIEEI